MQINLEILTKISKHKQKCIEPPLPRPSTKKPVRHVPPPFIHCPALDPPISRPATPDLRHPPPNPQQPPYSCKPLPSPFTLSNKMSTRRSVSPTYQRNPGPDGALSSRSQNDRKQTVTLDAKTAAAVDRRKSTARPSQALTRRSTFSDVMSRKSSTAVSHFPKAAARRGDLTSADECRLTGAWITWHLLIDSCHAVLRGAMKHWWRHCLYMDLHHRHSVVEKLEAERREFLKERDMLDSQKKEFEKNSASVEKELTATRTRAESEHVMVESLTETTNTKQNKIKELEERLAASETKNKKLETNYLQLVDKSIKLNHLVSRVASLPAVNPDDIQSFFEHVASESKTFFSGSKSPGHFARKLSTSPVKRRTFTEDTDYFTERRRRSHIASPSVYVVPSSSFFDQSATLGNSLTTFQNSKLNPANNPAKNTTTQEQPEQEDSLPGDESDKPDTPSLDNKDDPPKPVTDKPQLKHSDSTTGSFKKKKSIAGPKRGPVRPSASSQTGRKKRESEINEIGEELWKKINEPVASSASNAVAVAVRVRPLNKREVRHHEDNYASARSEATIIKIIIN